jgi:pimeloyl-ACP methyl ester carboxylesterase
MPKIRTEHITTSYEKQGDGEPIVLIPFLSVDHACYAFQVAEYAKHFTCLSVDLRGTGETENPDGRASIEVFADDVAALMQAMGMQKAHVFGLSLGAAIGMWVAAKYPETVRSLSLHSCWSKTDPFLKCVVEGWQIMAKALGSVQETVIRGIFPWCLTPELYAKNPDHVQTLVDFVRGRPEQPLETFIQHSNAVVEHDAVVQLGKITAPTQITFGRHDALTSIRFSDALTNGIGNTELVIFEESSHTPIYESVEEFNAKTLAFLQRHSV